MNSPEIFRQKKKLRHQIDSARKAISSAEKKEKSRRIQVSLSTHSKYQQAFCIHTYVSWQNEVDTHSLIKLSLTAGKSLVVPLINQKDHTLTHWLIGSFDDLQPGTFGILEPKTGRRKPAKIKDIDLIIVPGVAFDLRGNRLGFGGGYYDTFLSKSNAVKIGLAYQFQIVDDVPTRVEDQKVDLVITEENIFEINSEF